jgi:hypothetical protein
MPTGIRDGEKLGRALTVEDVDGVRLSSKVDEIPGAIENISAGLGASKVDGTSLISVTTAGATFGDALPSTFTGFSSGETLGRVLIDGDADGVRLREVRSDGLVEGVLLGNELSCGISKGAPIW